MVETGENDPDILVATWDAGVDPSLTLVSRVATTGHAANLTAPSVPPPADLTSFARFLRPTKLIPIDGIVKTTAAAITRGAGTDFEKARAIYDWIVENTVRDPATRGCGIGDIRFMLESKNLGGKCADLNALFVGLARAAGLPARDVYGLRVAGSKSGARSLGLASDDATKAQHCRAEVYLDRLRLGAGRSCRRPQGDARRSRRAICRWTTRRSSSARARLFGSWEMNWIAYNYAHDVTLPGSKRGTLGYFMYPQAETSAGRVDSLDPEGFKYSITVREVE